jgi:hypothetical protein
MSIDLLILSGCSSFTSISINDTSSLGHKVFQAVSPKVQPEKNHNQAALLALTSNDSGDPRRMVEFDAILFMATELDQEDIGFNFLKLIAVNFNYFDSNRTRGAVHAANARRHAYELLHAWRFFSASGFYSVNSANVADEPVVVLADQSEDMPTTFLKVSVVETVINLNQNLILSGLGQCESHNGVSGVPYLMDPVLKYFFPTKLAMVSDSSVIILLTPQDSVFANAQYQKSLSEYINAGRSFTKATRGTREDMQRFFERYPNRQDQKSNCFASCFFMLEDSELYCTLSLQELTSEDVALALLGPKTETGPYINEGETYG